MSKFITLIVFILIVQGVGALIGTSFMPDEWFQALNKPFFNPPPQIFGVVWPLLYLLIAIAGWRIFISEGEKPGWGLWLGQMVLNWAWSPLFFGAHQIFWAMCVLTLILVLSLAFISTVWHRDRFAGLCFVPYTVWLSFALLLNASIYFLNRAG